MSNSNTSALSCVQKTKQILERPEVQEKFREMLGKKASGFTTSVLSAMNSNYMLKDADPNSVYMAALTAASLDLPINENLGFAYIIPYKVKQGNQYITKAQFQVGYKGIKQLALRSGEFKTINESDVREGEIKSFNRLTGEIQFDWIQDYSERMAKQIVGYVSFFELTNGFTSTFYMSKDEVVQHATKYSQTFKKGTGVWKDNFEVMALKTVAKLNLSKNAPLSVEHVHRAIIADQSVINDAETLDVDYVDNSSENVDPLYERIETMIDSAKTVDDLIQIKTDLENNGHSIPEELLDEYEMKMVALSPEPIDEQAH